jgi:hypothetical protein
MLPRVIIEGVWIGNRIYGTLQLVSTSKDYALTVLYTSQIHMGHTRSSQSVTVFTRRCLVVAFNGRIPPSSVFPNCPRASATSSSQQQLTTEPQQSTNSPIYQHSLILITTSRDGPYRKKNFRLLQCSCWHGNMLPEPLLSIGCCIVTYVYFTVIT